MTSDSDDYGDSFSFYSFYLADSSNQTTPHDQGWSLRRAWRASMRELLAERAYIRRRGMAMWFYNDHLLFIVAVLLLVLVIMTVVIGKIVMIRKTAFSPNLPKTMPAITVSDSSLCLKPINTEDTFQPPGKIEIRHQNLPKYMRSLYEDNVVRQTVVAIPYTPISFSRLTVNQPDSVSRLPSPRPSASAPAIMTGLWARLENVLRPKKDERQDDRTDLNTRRSKSNEEVAAPSHHGQIYDDSYRQRYLCKDCQKMTCSHKTLGIAVCRSKNSLGFEGVCEDRWPSYMYPSRARYQQFSPTSSKNARIPKLSTFPRQPLSPGTFRVVNSRLGDIDGQSSDESDPEDGKKSPRL